MLIFWGITPLVSSVFAQSTVLIEAVTTVRTTTTLKPLREQSPAMNTNFMMTAYGITWLGQAMPAYVTSQGALEPFEADVERDTEQANETRTAQTRLYGTSLTCEPAIQDHSDPEDVSLSNGRSCKTDACF